MATFSTLTATLNLNIQNFANQLKAASRQVSSFAAGMNGGPVNAMQNLNKQTKAWGLNLKSVSRVVSGILISQAFYGMAQDIKSASSAVWDFTSELEYAKIAYSNLFGDTELANELINVLKDFAALTPFSFTESEQAAKRLLAYGVEYQNVMYVMKGVMSSAAMQGDPRKVEQISRALGQIYTKGRLMNEEMRQLAEAGIPAYEILIEKLGLTQKQLQNLGRESIPASTAINALVDGMTERFGTTMEASSRTLNGIISNIKDNATMLFTGIFEPFTTFMKSGLDSLGQFLFKMRELYELQGLGGVFEAIFPPDMHHTLRQFAANFLYLVNAFRELISQSGLLRAVFSSLITLFNAFAPIVSGVATGLAIVLKAITSNTTAMRFLSMALAAAAAMWVIFKIKALASTIVVGAINLIAKALVGLHAMLTFITVHPFWSLLIAITGVVVGLSGGFSKLGNAINGIFKGLTNISGIDPDKLLLPSQKERINDLDKFNKKLSGTSDAMDDLADSTGKAAKAGKSLLSFDEVFKLKDPDEGTGSGIEGTEIPDVEVPSIDVPSLDLGGSFVPEVPDFTDYFSDFVDQYVDSFVQAWDKVKTKIPAILAGAFGGGVLGAVLGGPAGAAIGALAGSIAGYFWEKLAEKLKLTGWGKISVPIGIGVGAAIGMVVGGPGGAFIGAAIGGFVGWFVETIAQGIERGDWGEFAVSLSAMIGGVVGFLLGGPVGSIAGLLAGGLIGLIATKFMENWEEVKKAFTEPWKKAILGSQTDMTEWIGTLARGIAKSVKEGDWLGVGFNIVLGILKGLTMPISETFRSAKALFDSIVGAIKAAFGIHSPATKMKPIGKNILLGILEGFTESVEEMLNSIGEFANKVIEKSLELFDSLTDNSRQAWDNITTYLFDGLGKVGEWLSNLYNDVSSTFSNVWTSVSDWLGKSVDTAVEKFTDIRDTAKSWLTKTWNVVEEKFHSIWISVDKWLADTWQTVETKFTDIWTSVDKWLSDTWQTVETKFTDIWNSVKDYVGKTYEEVKTGFSDMYDSMSGKLSEMYDKVKETVHNTYLSFKNWATDLKNNVFDKVSGWIGDLIDKFQKLIDKAKEAAKAAVEKVTGKSSSSSPSTGHATGGIFNREHIARFAEGNKAEAVIPLENASAMQPFVNAISQGILEGLAPALLQTSSPSGGSDLPPMYVGTLIADDRGLKQLYKKFELIQVQENARRGLVT